MKPSPLPPNPKLFDRVEYALQWMLSWAIVYWPERPMLSGFISGLLIAIPFLGVASLIVYFQYEHLIRVLQETGHWKP